jgi:nucleotide-binding universal stress UspA family protein
MTRVRASEGQATEARVVVGYDGSDSARRAVARGVRAAGPRGQVILVTVEPKMHADGIAAEQFVEPGDQPSQLLADAHAIAARTCATDATDVRTVAVARQGNPADEILDAARAADADLIVVGRTGKSFLARAILGSVAVRVVQLAHCDILVVA